MYVKGLRWKVTKRWEPVQNWNGLVPVYGPASVVEAKVEVEDRVLQMLVERDGLEVWEDVPIYYADEYREQEKTGTLKLKSGPGGPP